VFQQRLNELRTELAKGEQQLERLDRERSGVRDTILRIQGAIQVLEELAVAESEPRPVLAQTS
jgi:prefoldin subunit 5